MGCNTCAHVEYCELGAECVNEGYQYHFDKISVRGWEGEYIHSYFMTGGWYQ